MRNGNGNGGWNYVSAKYKAALQRLEEAGLIQRGEEFIRIVDRRALLDRALRDVHNPHHGKFLAIEQAAREVARQIDNETRVNVAAIRKEELRHIQGLMQSGGGRDSRRRSVRQESGDIIVPLGGVARRAFPGRRYD